MYTKVYNHVKTPIDFICFADTIWKKTNLYGKKNNRNEINQIQIYNNIKYIDWKFWFLKQIPENASLLAFFVIRQGYTKRLKVWFMQITLCDKEHHLPDELELRVPQADYVDVHHLEGQRHLGRSAWRRLGDVDLADAQRVKSGHLIRWNACVRYIIVYSANLVSRFKII